MSLVKMKPLGASQTPENPNPKNKDWLSDLPDPIIHHIFSLLETNYIASFSVLSKRFRNLCSTSPYLSFTPKPCKPGCKFRSFLDEFWRSRGCDDDASSICRFHIGNNNYHQKCLEHSNYSVFYSWIDEAVKRNVQELDLSIDCLTVEIVVPGHFFVLPKCVFNCQTLTVLKLCLAGGNLELSRVILPSLEVLSLWSVGFVKDGENENTLCKWISSFCPSLKILNLGALQQNSNFSITSSSLEDLTIFTSNELQSCDISISTENLKNLNLNISMQHDSDIGVRIVAPNLHNFTWSARHVDINYSGKFMSLHNAFISVEAGVGKMDFDALLQSISQAAIVQISMWVIEMLFENPHWHHPILFENLNHLVLRAYSFGDEHILAVTSFLKGMVNLKSLAITCDCTVEHNDDEVGHQLVEEVCLRNCIFDTENKDELRNIALVETLREVEVELNEKMDVIGLVKYLLKHAKSLKKMTVIYPSSNFDSLSRIDIGNFETASTFVEIYFVEKE